MRLLAISLALFLSSPAIADQKPSPIFRALQQKSVETIVMAVPQSNQLRLAQLKQTFSDVECRGEDLREQATQEGANLLCTLPGISSDTILLVAHYQRVGQGMSVLDDWSGAVMLPLLYRALTAAPRQHTFIFAAFSGVGGVKTFLASLTKAQRHAIRAVIALDSLGLGPIRFYIHQSGSVPSPAEDFLRVQLLEAADNQGLKSPESSIPDSWFRIDDTREFRYNGVPAILVHSVDRSNRNIPGSLDDKVADIDRDIYFASYMTLCYYVVKLDQMTDMPGTQSSSPSRGRR